jgi:hypothetical protein
MEKYNDVIEQDREAWLRAKGKVLMFVEVPFMLLGMVIGSIFRPKHKDY